MKKLDLKNKSFGRLLVIQENKPASIPGKVMWDCVCTCGNKITTSRANLAKGDTKSCGCLEHDLLVQRNLKHGKSKTPEYIIWKGIKARCYNQKASHYKEYGGRGICVSGFWLNSFETFLKDMGVKPGKEYTIERRDNNGNYQKENCYWATRKEQAANKRNNRIIEYNGKTNILSGWANEFKIPVSTLHSALKINTFDIVYNKFISK